MTRGRGEEVKNIDLFHGMLFEWPLGKIKSFSDFMKLVSPRLIDSLQ